MQVAALQPLYDAWSFRVLPRARAGWSPGTRTATGIWPKSIRTFPDQETLAGMMRDGRVLPRVDTCRNLSGRHRGASTPGGGWRPLFDASCCTRMTAASGSC